MHLIEALAVVETIKARCTKAEREALSVVVEAATHPVMVASFDSVVVDDMPGIQTTYRCDFPQSAPADPIPEFTGPSRVPHNGTATSIAAANHMDESGRAVALEQRVYDHLLSCGATGSTDEETEVALGMIHRTAAPRRLALVEKGLVVKSLMKRRNASSGMMATVWKAAQRADGITSAFS